ncbi:transposase [Cetobacterium sp.]|uniref:transposase n=1 Tax=Cetobacterium sp. TaxID=2071632 RepID=UPI003F3D5B91
MAKYSYEFKLQVVQAYLDGEGGYRYLSKKYGVPSKRDIEKWVFAYRPRVVFFVLLHQLAFLVNKIKAFWCLNLKP